MSNPLTCRTKVHEAVSLLLTTVIIGLRLESPVSLPHYLESVFHGTMSVILRRGERSGTT